MHNIGNLTSLQVERTPDNVALNYMQHAGLTPSIEGILPFSSFELIRLSYKETTLSFLLSSTNNVLMKTCCCTTR